MKRKDFATLQAVYSILGMQLSRKPGGLFIAGRFANIPGKCCYQTVKTTSEELIKDVSAVYTQFLFMEKDELEKVQNEA
jgi:hypothetical protein